MATTLLGRIYQTNISEEYNYEDGTATASYDVVFLVQATSDCGDEATILATEGVPKLTQRSELFPYMYVTSRSASESSEGGIWTVPVSYATISRSDKPNDDEEDPNQPDNNEPKDLEQPPWKDPWKVRYGSTTKPSLKPRMIYLGAFQDEAGGAAVPPPFTWLNPAKLGKDAYGNTLTPTTNSAGEPIFYDGVRGLRTYNVQSNHETAGAPTTWLKRQGTINSKTRTMGLYGSTEGGKILVESCEVGQEWWQNPVTRGYEKYYTMDLKFLIDPLGHFVEFADVGSLVFEGSRSMQDGLEHAAYALGPDGNPTTVNLNGTGGKAADGSSPLFLRYVEHPIGDW